MSTARTAALGAAALALTAAPVLAAPEPAQAHACPVVVDTAAVRPHLERAPVRGEVCTNCVIELHVVIDNALTSQMGGASSTEFILAIVDAANAILSKPQSEGGLDLDLIIAGGTEFAGPQPWAPSSNPITLLNNFRGWVASDLPVPADDRDVVVLISGANLDGGTTGLSFPDSVCSENGIALITSFTNDTDVLGTVLAHMLGHMLGAGHDGIDNDCASTGFVMSPFIDPFTPATEYSECSIAEINAFLASGLSCLAAESCGPADMAEPYTQLDFSDVVAFLVAFDAMDPAADLANPFGFYNFSDVTAFLTMFAAGCP